MKIDSILGKLTKESSDRAIENLIKINRFISKYSQARICFYSDEETDDLYHLLFDLSSEFNIPEDEIYFIFLESKFELDGRLKTGFEEDFATLITITETINK